jgi:hypothetical protein
MTSTTIARLMNNESMCRRIRSMSRTVSARKIATQLRADLAGWAMFITTEDAEWFVDAVLCDDLADA